jgi:hypothetical protein
MSNITMPSLLETSVKEPFNKDKFISYLDTTLTLLVTSSLALSLSLGMLVMLASPGQPLDFLFSSSCITPV